MREPSPGKFCWIYDSNSNLWCLLRNNCILSKDFTNWATEAHMDEILIMINTDV